MQPSARYCWGFCMDNKDHTKEKKKTTLSAARNCLIESSSKQQWRSRGQMPGKLQINSPPQRKNPRTIAAKCKSARSWKKKPVEPQVAPHEEEPAVPATRQRQPKGRSSFDKASEDAHIPPQPGDSGFLRRRMRVERAGTSHGSKEGRTQSSSSLKSVRKPDNKNLKRSVAPRSLIS